eukprot:4157183-Amphidinium_carterae.1
MGNNFRGQLGTGDTSTLLELPPQRAKRPKGWQKRASHAHCPWRNNQGQLCRGNNNDEVRYRQIFSGSPSQHAARKKLSTRQTWSSWILAKYNLRVARL